MAEQEECTLNNVFLENSNIKEEFKVDSYIDVYESSINANETELKNTVWDGGIREYEIVNDMKIDLSSSEACRIVVNDNIKIKNEINSDDIKTEFDNKLLSSTEYKIASVVDDMKLKPPSFEACDIVVNNNVKIKKEISPDDIKVEVDNKLLFCDHCNEHYEDYCSRCGMLAHILNGNTLSITDGRAIKEMPNNILEIRESTGHVGVFALKVIPEGVKMGPFNGLSTSEPPWRLKGGKFIAPKDKLKPLNWMQYVNPAKNIFQQNLIPFQREGKLFYHSKREILVGEELLVYFGDEYEDCVNKDIEIDFIAPTEDDVTDVFACAHCCLGFSSRGCLVKHKTTCLNETNGRSFISEITQCPVCNIYFYEKEYLECHMPYCCGRNVRNCIPLALDNQTEKVNRLKTERLQMYKCSQCKYKTSYKSVLRRHLDEHYEVKMYRCDICSRQFKTKGSLKLHVKYKHIAVEGNVGQTRSTRAHMKANTKARSSKVQHLKCKLQTKYKYYLDNHVTTKHFKKNSCECETCGYKTNQKSKLETYVKSEHLKYEICGYKVNLKSKHLKKFSYECEVCDYKTYLRPRLQRHIKSKHLKQFSYECEKCDYKTNLKSHLELHVKSIHLKELSYKCDVCDYKSNQKSHLERHIKGIHLNEFSYECDICEYKSNQKSHLNMHIKSTHLKQFSYKCEICDYKTNQKTNLEKHIKSKHLKEFSCECNMCDYKTNRKSDLQGHIKTQHLKQFSYDCEICDYKTNRKSNLEIHVKSKHLKQFSYDCELCDYKTNIKLNLERHVESKHLKLFSLQCEMCDYKTNQKLNLEIHVKSKHLKQFSYECEKCNYKTNLKPHLQRHIKSKHL